MPSGAAAYVGQRLSFAIHQMGGSILLPGWQTSRGSQMEYEEARRQGLVIWDVQRETEGSAEVNRLLMQAARLAGGEQACN